MIVETFRILIGEPEEQEPATYRARLAPPPSRPPQGVTIERTELAGRAAIRFVPDGGSSTRTILHFHGGGYVVGEVEQELPWCGALAKLSGATVVTADYRLAPEHPYPAAVHDAAASIRGLVDSGVRAHDVVVTGDSAGGGLALAALLELRDDGGPRVAAAVLGSPWLDLGSDYEAAGEQCPDYLPVSTLQRWAQMYAGSTPLDDPRLSPFHAELHDLPPLVLVTGERERFTPDILDFARRAEAAGVKVQTYVGADAVHCWYKTNGLMPGPSDGAERFAELVRSAWSASPS